MSYPSHQISRAVESQTRGRRCGVIALLILGAGALFAVSTIAPRPAEGFVCQEPPLEIDDGLTEEESEFINRPISELTPEERKRRDKILKKMETHLLKMMEKRGQLKKEQERNKKTETKRPPTSRPKRPTRRPTQQPKGDEPEAKEEEVKEEDAPKRPAIARPRKTFIPSGAEPPAEPEGNYRLPFDQRQYSFGLRNGSYIDLVDMFTRKTGLSAMGVPVKLVGARPEDSLISYVSGELTDFRTTLHQINDLLFYEVLPPLYLYYNADEFRLELDAFKELRFKLPPSRLFTSIESVELEVAQGKLMPSDIVRVFFTPETAANMRVFNEQVSNMFGEWVLMTIVEGTGVIDYTGRVDILDKIQLYMKKLVVGLGGEVELTILPVEYIEPSEALEKLMLLVDNVITGASEGNFRGRRTNRGRSPKDDPTTSEAQKILVIPDDDYDVLLVRGLPYKVAEVKNMLEFIDRPPADPDYPDPVVIKLKHAQAESAAEILEEIVNGGRKPRIRAGRPKKGEASRVVASGGNDKLQIIPYPRSNSLVLLGSEERIGHAKRIIAEVLDKELDDRFLQVPVEQADPEQIAAKVLSLLAPPGKKGDRGPETLNIEVIGSVLFLRGEPALMNTAASLIKELDGQMPKPTVFVARLENAKPSEVVNYLRLIMAQGAAPGPKNKRGPRPSGNTARFVDDDATGRVFFRGSQREWEHDILPLIELFDEARDDKAGGNIEFVEIKFADPNNIVSTLNSVYGGGAKRGKVDKHGPQFIPTPRGVIITGTVSGSELKHIRLMIDLMDPDLDKFEKRTFMLTHIEPEEVEDAIISLFVAPTSGGGGRQGKGRAPSPAQTIRMALISGGIIVHAPKEDMPNLAEFIEQLDSDGNSPKFLRRNFDLEHADPQVVQGAIHNLFSAGGVAPKGSKRRPPTGALDKDTIRTSISARSIIVFAAEERFAEIEEVIQILDRPAAEDAIVTRRFEIIYADAAELADQLEQMLQVKLSEMQSRASGKDKARVGKPALSVLANPKSSDIWITAPLSIVEHAAKLVPELDREEGEIETIYKIYDCVNAKAEDLADLLNALYGGGGIQMPRLSGGKKKDASSRARDRIKRRLESGPEDLNIVALPGNQAVSISGPRKKVEQALIRAIELDHKSQRIESFTKTFTLLWADVDGVADGIIEMLGDKARGGARKASDDLDLWDFETGPRRAGDISVWPRYETSSLIVHAPADKMVLIEAFIGQCELLANPGNINLPVRDEPFVFYRPKYLGAYEIVSMTRMVISTVYTNSLPVDLDYLDRNTVVLKGTRRYFDDVLDLIAKYVDTKENAFAVEPVTSFLPPVPGNMQVAQVIGMVSRILTDLDVEMQDVSGMTGALLGDNIPEIPGGPE